LLEGKSNSHREYVLSGLNKWRMVFDGQYKLILTRGKKPVLYDLVNDPLENQDIADRKPIHVKRLTELIPLQSRKAAE